MKFSVVSTAAFLLIAGHATDVLARISKEGQILTYQAHVICRHQEAGEEISDLTIRFEGYGRIGEPDRHVYIIKEHELKEVSEFGVADTLPWDDQQGKSLFFFDSELFSDNPTATFVWAIHRIGPEGNVREDYSGGVIHGNCRWRGV